ncbi:MAG: hypothetical protein JWP35_3107 [Caulobacter sp.]|nr:hypothetical protein [Caulobacter sp.]
MGRLGLWLSIILVVAAVGAGLWAYWNFDLRWRPKTITKHQAEITKILEASGYVSPRLPGPKLYMISFRSCPDCIRFKTEEWPGLHAAGVDTRLIEIARRDVNGIAKSKPAERSTVAELWINRSWTLSQQWDDTPIDAWTAPGIPPADGDIARTAVVEAGRNMIDQLKPLLADNGIALRYPTLIWWDKEGRMRGCACEKRETYRFVRAELGARKK